MSVRSPMPQKRVFSGIQPSGHLHLGNYLGAIANFVTLQEEFECIYCVVDMHAITTWQDPLDLTRRTREVMAGLLAAGVDPDRSVLFNQSQVAEHAELAWITTCVARMGWLGRMTQFKDKAGKSRENASVGLFTYPNLMAADILAYRATHVPVGEDQRQHLELTRDIAQKFNMDFARRLTDLGFDETYFPLPESVIQGPAVRIMSLRDGLKKMSSSDSSDYARLNMLDDADTIALKVRKAKTDAEALPGDFGGLEGRPEAENLVVVYAALAGSTPQDVLREHGGAQFFTFKQALIDLAVARLGPISDEMNRLIADPSHLDSLLCKGAECARTLCAPVLRDIREVVGFVTPCR